jgi:hypothetical protein
LVGSPEDELQLWVYCCITLTTGLFGGGVICARLHLVGSLEDELWLRLWLLLGPWPASPTHLAGDVLVIVSSQRWGLPLGRVLLVILSITSGMWVTSSSACLGRSLSYTHTYIQQACPCRPWVLWRRPGATIPAPSAPRIGGPQLQIMATPQWWLRRISWHVDGGDERPL